MSFFHRIFQTISSAKAGLAVGLLLVSRSVLAAEIALPTPEIETLPNGLKLVWFLSDKLPVVDLALLVQSGHRDDPHGKSGTSELVAATLDRGAGGMSVAELARAVERLGASRYASADEESFSVGMHGLAPDADRLLEILSKMVVKPEFSAVEVAREHGRLLDRWRHIGDQGETLAAIAYRRLMSGGTAYGRGGFVSAKEFESVKHADVLAWHQKHFTPKNSVLMVVGRVDRAQFKQKIEALFGGWKGEAPTREKRTYVDARMGLSKPGTIVVVDRPNLNQAQVRIGLPAPLLKDPDHYSLVVGNALIGEYFHSRLNALIRDKLGLTYGIGSSFAYNRELGVFTVGAATRNETVGSLVSETMKVLKETRKGPIDDAEVTMAKEYLMGSFPLSTSTLGAVASRWLAGYIFELGPEYLNEFVPKVRATTQAQVQTALAKHLKFDQATVVIAGDAKAIEKSLRLAGFPSIRRVSAADLF
jgi:zinc protease